MNVLYCAQLSWVLPGSCERAIVLWELPPEAERGLKMELWKYALCSFITEYIYILPSMSICHQISGTCWSHSSLFDTGVSARWLDVLWEAWGHRHWPERVGFIGVIP